MEEYVLVCLKKQQKNDLNIEVHGQKSKHFEWDYDSIQIVIEKGDETFIIDTKWKNINGSKPSTDDLRQMYVYNDYWNPSKTMLLYPSNTTTFTKGILFLLIK
jgi:5-methylcytosine-specific restriction enzyme subunit McrC